MGRPLGDGAGGTWLDRSAWQLSAVYDLPQQLAEFAANTERRLEVVERQLDAQGAEYLTRFTGRRALALVAGRRFDDRVSKAVKSGAVAWYELSAQALQED